MPPSPPCRRDAGEEMITMNVQQLIDALTALDDKTMTVLLEGCDCYTTANGTVSILGSATVLIEADS